jgi:hypothetical protein
MNPTKDTLSFWMNKLERVDNKNVILNFREDGSHFEGASICFSDLYCGLWVDHKKRLCWEVRRKPNHILNLTPDGARLDGNKCDYEIILQILKKLRAVMIVQQENNFLLQIPIYCDKGRSIIRGFNSGDAPPPENLTRIYHFLMLCLKDHKNILTKNQMNAVKDTLAGIQPVLRHMERLYPGWHPG